ncbi:MAG: hypothetical protein WCF85_19540 [Rhodospirillaceae bacterium]
MFTRHSLFAAVLFLVSFQGLAVASDTSAQNWSASPQFDTTMPSSYYSLNHDNIKQACDALNQLLMSCGMMDSFHNKTNTIVHQQGDIVDLFIATAFALMISGLYYYAMIIVVRIHGYIRARQEYTNTRLNG